MKPGKKKTEGLVVLQNRNKSEEVKAEDWGQKGLCKLRKNGCSLLDRKLKRKAKKSGTFLQEEEGEKRHTLKKEEGVPAYTVRPKVVPIGKIDGACKGKKWFSKKKKKSKSTRA